MGKPIVVKGIQLKGTSQWGPNYFSLRHGVQRVTIINCETSEMRVISLAEFMATMGRPQVDGEIWKLKVRKVATTSIDRTDENLTRTGHQRKILQMYSPTLIRHSRMEFHLGIIHAKMECSTMRLFSLPMGFSRI